MDSKREQALVGLFVLIASALLIVTLFLVSGAFTQGDIPFRAYFNNAGGLIPGSEVHYAGGPPIGRVKAVNPDPNDPTRMIIEFVVHPDVPVKKDSKVTITSNSPLGDNFLGIIPGSATSPKAHPDDVLNSVEFISFSDLVDKLSDLGPSAQDLLKNLNARVTTFQTTLERINDVLNDQNRRNISETLADLHGTLHENRALIHDTLLHIDDLSKRLEPLVGKADTTITHVDNFVVKADDVLTENRENLRVSLQEFRAALAKADSVLAQIDNITTGNSDNLDEIIMNLRDATENLNAFTETIKTRPSTLLRSPSPKEHKPGEEMPK